MARFKGFSPTRATPGGSAVSGTAITCVSDVAAICRTWLQADARHEQAAFLAARRLPCGLAFGSGSGLPVGGDHAPGAVERAFAQLEAEQPVALERARQRQLAGLGGREAEAGVIGRVAEQDYRAMATRLRRRERVVHQRSPDAELAGGSLHRQRAEHERRDAPDADVPQPHGAHQAALAHGRQGKAFGGRASVAQALAGARMAVVAKAGIQQRFARSDVRGSFRTDRERSGIGE